MPDPPSQCDAACQKIIIDGRIMINRAEYLIDTLRLQEEKASVLRSTATKDELTELLANSVKQCEFSKLIEASANETAYLMSEIMSRAAGIQDDDVVSKLP